ncbi:MAG: helix-turn-helix domain-containing protein [Simplicispira sp.]|uniref:helix-turn-helix transcriptional regulator n=1 Tax=Simplicispira sp. TaxID=2015802 RepID=UPI002584CDEE|nr:helix-turn-helix domain-containing protein [Simplicispira sp.]MDD2690224.1 helix-turn-helix domain-containing protein [Simplicispira sp.]
MPRIIELHPGESVTLADGTVVKAVSSPAADLQSSLLVSGATMTSRDALKNNLKSIRERLCVSQQALAAGIGCTQGNVGHYERGQTLPPEMARKVINFARLHGLELSFDHIYGSASLPIITAAQKAGA